MTVHYEGHGVTLLHGDCLDVLPSLADSSIDAVVCDPPYGLEFMGKGWDGADGFRRSLNPNDAGRDNAFGRTSRTSPEYRTGRGARVLTERVEELTPRGKGHTTSAGPYLASGVDSVRVARPLFQQWCEAWAVECLRVLKPGGHMVAFGGTRTWHRLACAIEDAGFEVRDSLAWMYGCGFPKSHNLVDEDGDRTGWGTALKPAFEPIVLARKPLAGTVAGNVLTHGAGALNIDGCRVGTDVMPRTESDGTVKSPNESTAGHNTGRPPAGVVTGRWPANAVLDEFTAAELDAQTGERPAGGKVTGRQDARTGASRFFYTAKADTDERPRINGIVHPTVKPLDLMRWLVRLVTPVGGTVLEPFAGSGTTVEACLLEGFQCTAIEREDDYLPLILQRINRQRDPVEAIRQRNEDLGLFSTLNEMGA